MNADLIVRPLAPEDHAAWLELWDGCNAFYERAGPTALAPEVTAATWARFFDPAEPVHALVAVLGGRVVGLAHFLFHRSTTRLEMAGYLQDLFTRPDCRGHGVGRALMEAVRAAMAAAGLPNFYWHTHQTNATARRLYDDLAGGASGFIHYRLGTEA